MFAVPAMPPPCQVRSEKDEDSGEITSSWRFARGHTFARPTESWDWARNWPGTQGSRRTLLHLTAFLRPTAAFLA